MVAPVPCAGVEHLLREGVDLRHLGHGPVERGVETSHLRQTGERLGQSTGASHVVGLMRRLHARRDESRADELEREAGAAIDYAISSVEQAKLAAIDAVIGRLDAIAARKA